MSSRRLFWTSAGATLIALVATAFLFCGCDSPTASQRHQDGPRSGLGLKVVGYEDLVHLDMRAIDKAWAKVNDCWETNEDGTRFAVIVQDLWPYATASYVSIRPETKYPTLRHELSHLCGAWVLGYLPPNGYGKCWL